jgi:putative DNA primase/helicase
MASTESLETALAKTLASLPLADLTDDKEIRASVSVTPIESATSAVPAGFELNPKGLFKETADGGEQIAGPLKVTGATRNERGESWGHRLEWQDPDQRPHRWNMPTRMLSSDPISVAARLRDGGLYIAPGSGPQRALIAYMANAKPKARFSAVDRGGWHEVGGKHCFVLPDQTLVAYGKAEVFLQSDNTSVHLPVAQQGTLEEWKEGVAIYAVDNSRLAFSISISFAAPLLAMVGAESGGFHLKGPSSVGKSTGLKVAGSVFYGGGLRGGLGSWRATDNSQEAKAAAHCDLPMALDEMGEADPNTVGKTAYMLANGMGKGRANVDGSAKPASEWRVLFLSSGEVGLNEVMAGAKAGEKTARAGQEVRINDFPAKAGPLGLFDTCHDFEGPKQFAEYLSVASQRYYGTAGLAWLRYLVAHRDAVAVVAKDLMKVFVAANVPQGADGQVGRVANRFGLVAAAGEIATHAGIVPWPVGEATRAAARCFGDWLSNRAGGDGASEDAQALSQVRAFLETYGESRFTPILPELTGETSEQTVQPAEVSRIPIQRAGFRRWDNGSWTYLISPEVWKKEVCAGLNPTEVGRSLVDKGHLVKGDGDNLAAQHRVPSNSKKQRFYTIRSSIFEE